MTKAFTDETCDTTPDLRDDYHDLLQKLKQKYYLLKLSESNKALYLIILNSFIH